MGFTTYTMTTKGTSKEHRLKIKQQVVRLAQQEGIKPCVRKFGIARNTIRNWLRRYEQAGIRGLLDKRKGPNVIHHKTSKDLEDQIIAIRQRSPCFGPLRIKYFYEVPVGRGAIQRIIKVNGLSRRRRKKTEKKRDLRHVKALYKIFNHMQFDLKYLRDIANYWVQKEIYGLPKYQYTIRDTKSGWVFLGYSDEISELNARTMAAYAVNHLLSSLPIDAQDILIQTDNGSEFSGAGRRVKTASFVRALLEDLRVKHAYIPPGLCNANADVESFHNTIEEEFFNLVQAHSKEDFFRKVETYRLWYNLERPNFSKKGRTPLRMVEEECSDEIAHGRLACISTVDLDKISYIAPKQRGQSLPGFPADGY